MRAKFRFPVKVERKLNVNMEIWTLSEKDGNSAAPSQAYRYMQKYLILFSTMSCLVFERETLLKMCVCQIFYTTLRELGLNEQKHFQVYEKLY
jgi:hypothetical protein